MDMKKEQEVVYMSPIGRASLQKYNNRIATIISDDGDTVTIEFEGGAKLTEVPKTQLRFIK
jgi:hypothetical protein